jgi:hypothetical protein
MGEEFPQRQGVESYPDRCKPSSDDNREVTKREDELVFRILLEHLSALLTARNKEVYMFPDKLFNPV